MIDTVAVRSATSGDRSYVFATWLRSMRSPPSLPTGQWRALLAATLCGCDVTIAGLSDDPDVIVGWIATHAGELVWGYVPFRLRGKGLFRVLRHAAGVDDGSYGATESRHSSARTAAAKESA